MARIRVLVEQQVIPPYRVPFFTRLSREVDLLLLASEGVSFPGVSDVRERLPFRATRSREVRLRPWGAAYHQRILDTLREFRPQVCISREEFLFAFCCHPGLALGLRPVRPGLVLWDCAGYTVEDFALSREKRLASSSLLRHPRVALPNKLRQRCLRSLDGFLAYSEHTARYWQEVHDVPASKITVAYNSIDVDPFLRLRRTCDAEGAPRIPGQILFVGRLTEGKRIDLLLRAYRQIQERHAATSLRIIGDGPEDASLRSLAGALALRDVQFLGAIYDQDRLAELMYPASLFVMPGLGGLGFNSAMAVGLPIVCGRADGTERHLVEQDRNGLYFDGTEEGLVGVLDQALSRPEHLARMGRRSAELIETRFNLDTMVAAFVERISKVAECRGQAHG